MNLRQLLDLFLHIDDHLLALVPEYGIWIYAILFVIVFAETGLVITPFLPGDSLLFAAGAICAATTRDASPSSGLSIAVVVPLLTVAAVIGDAVNYRIGLAMGPGFLERRLARDGTPRGLARFINRSHLERAQRFYERHGGKTIILARFAPIIRTFAPFVAGIAKMEYRRFFVFNLIGAVAWVSICSFAGYFFGDLPVVKDNFELVVLAIVFISVVPIGIELLRGLFGKREPTRTLEDIAGTWEHDPVADEALKEQRTVDPNL